MIMRSILSRSLSAIFLFAPIAGAQSVNTLRPATSVTVSGVVFDSIAKGPLSAAVVQLVSADNPALLGRTATSDSLGRYTLSDVPDGRYAIGFLHPILDSLGVDLPVREVTVAGKTVRVDIGIPSGARLRVAICGAQSRNDSSGVLIGTVRDARDGMPAAGVTVTGEWLEFAVARAGVVRTMPKRVATTGDNGWFAMCTVPTTGIVALMATRGADSTGRVEVQIPNEGFARRELFLGDAESVVIPDTVKRADTTSSLPRRISVGKGWLSGTVVAAVGGKPIANASVRITGGPQARTNERGEWTIANAPGGTRMLETRAIGFYPVSRHVDVVPGAGPVRVALSTMQSVLDTVRITAERLADRHMSGFADRRRSGMGSYMTAADIERHRPLATSDVLRMMPGVYVERSGVGDAELSVRGMFTERCTPAVFVDGHWMRSFTADDIDMYVRPNRLMGIEVYTRGSVPPQFEPGLSGCGAVVIWTK